MLAGKLMRDVPILTYEVPSLESFPGDEQRIGIAVILVRNEGSREVEDLQCSIDLVGATIVETRCKGIPINADGVNVGGSNVRVTAPYLNPGESLSIQLLANPSSDELAEPRVDIRGRGAVAAKRTETGVSADSPGENVLQLLPALLAMMVAMTASAQLMGRRVGKIIVRRSGSRLSGEPQDGFAFLLGVHGFQAEAAKLRSSTREHSWWALSDAFVESLLAPTEHDPEAIRRGINVLCELLAPVHLVTSESRAIIATNVVRLALFVGDREVATRELQRAREFSSKTTEQRCAMVPELLEFRDYPDK